MQKMFCFHIIIIIIITSYFLLFYVYTISCKYKLYFYVEKNPSIITVIQILYRTGYDKDQYNCAQALSLSVDLGTEESSSG